jgi:hypothetical protein
LRQGDLSHTHLSTPFDPSTKPGANPYITDDRGRTALDLVCFLGRNEKVKQMEGMLLVRTLVSGTRRTMEPASYQQQPTQKQNAMREPERALLLHKARVLKEAREYLPSPSTGTPVAIGSTEGGQERLMALAPKCLRVREFVNVLFLALSYQATDTHSTHNNVCQCLYMYVLPPPPF